MELAYLGPGDSGGYWIRQEFPDGTHSRQVQVSVGEFIVIVDKDGGSAVYEFTELRGDRAIVAWRWDVPIHENALEEGASIGPYRIPQARPDPVDPEAHFNTILAFVLMALLALGFLVFRLLR